MSTMTDARYEQMLDQTEAAVGFRVRATFAAYAPGDFDRRTVVERASRIRPCPTCSQPTRPTGWTIADYPGTIIRGKGGICKRCSYVPKDPQRVRRTIPTLDVAAAVEAYQAGISSTTIARNTDHYPGTVVRALVAAGVVMRTRSQAALARERAA